MKKIPVLFEMEYLSKHERRITDKVTPGMEWVLNGEGSATFKFDGAACAIINGMFYKRFDAKPGRKIPRDAIPCQPEADPVTGHFPHWVPVSTDNPADKWFVDAFVNSEAILAIVNEHCFPDFVQDKNDYVSFEAIGPSFNGNHHDLKKNYLIPHGIHGIKETRNIGRSFEAIRDYLEQTNIEGLVFWKDGEPRCKIRRRDFGFDWPVKESKQE